MNYFFGFESTGQYEFIYNLNHLVLVLLVIGALFALYFGLHAKTDKGIRITKTVLASTMLFFEGGRYIYLMIYYSSIHSSFDWIGRIPFSMCGIMSITTIAVLYVSAFHKTNGRTMQLFYNILFGCAMWGGILTFGSPEIINGEFSIMHFRNFQSIFIHIMLIFAPIYLIKIGELKVRLKNFWMVAVGYLAIGIISMTGSQTTGNNYANALYIDMIRGWNIHIPFPWHLPPMFLALLVVPAVYYCVFEFAYKKWNPLPAQSKQFSKGQWTILSCGFILSFALILLIPSWLGATPIENGLGLLCLVPLGTLIAGIWFAYRNNPLT
ncbi:MAG: YwaF family protein [Defluviitaleaceae bacterium]|nr:YwaF family protein [Defluviitaleaceae bacterium]